MSEILHSILLAMHCSCLLNRFAAFFLIKGSLINALICDPDLFQKNDSALEIPGCPRFDIRLEENRNQNSVFICTQHICSIAYTLEVSMGEKMHVHTDLDCVSISYWRDTKLACAITHLLMMVWYKQSTYHADLDRHLYL